MKRTNVSVANKAFAAVVTVLLAASVLVAAGFGARAYAEEQVSVDFGNGWVATCSVSDGEATVLSCTYSGEGTADLSIPETIDADGSQVPIVTLGKEALMGCSAVDNLTLPNNLKFVEESALLKTSATSIAFGTGLVYIEDYGVARNENLVSLTFAEGCHPEYFSTGAFSNNTALTQLEIPGLRGRNYTTAWTPNRIGAGCFNNDSALEKLIYDPDTTDPSSYYTLGNNSSPIYNNCKNLTLVTGLSLATVATNSTNSPVSAYYAVYFYGSEADAKADTYREYCNSYVLIKKGTTLTDICTGAVSSELIYDASGDTSSFTTNALTSIPTVSSFGTTDDQYVWGFSDFAFSSASSSLGSSLSAYPVNRADMNYAYLTSPEIRNYSANSGMGSSVTSRGNECYFRLRDDGTTDFSSVEVYSVDGKLVDPSQYTLYFRKATQTGQFSYSYEEFSDPAGVNTAGTYGLCALGIGDYQNSTTEWSTIYVRRYDGTLYDYTQGTVGEGNGSVSYNTAKMLTSHRLVVMAPDSSWQASILATALAGAGEGLAVFSDGTDKVSKTFQAITQARVNYLVFVGSKTAISQDAISRAQLLYTSGTDEGASSFVDADQSSYSGTGDSYASALACQVYETFKKAGARLDDPFQWGTTAILMSGTAGSNAMAVAQYAYSTGSPVFFTNDSGLLSSRTRTCLKDFQNLVVVGSEGEISAKTLEQAASQVESKTATRIMANEDAFENSVELAGLLQNGEGALPGVSSAATLKTTCVSDAVNPSCVCSNAQYAALSNGVLYACKGSVELKKAAQKMIEAGSDNVTTVSLVGPLQSSGLSVADRVASIWSVNDKATTSVEVGDTFACGNLMMRITGASTASVAGVLDHTQQSIAVPATATYDGVVYTVSAFDAAAFASNTVVREINFDSASSIKAVPAKAFANCSALATVKLPAGVTSLGTAAFSGCKALSSVALPSGVKALPASLFSGCTSLKSLAIPAAATTIGASAFSGCTALASISIPANVSSVGANAFAGCTKLASASFAGGSKVSALGAGVFSSCTALKAVSLPAKLSSIGTGTFKGCSSLAAVSLPAKLTTIGAQAFYGCGLKKMTLSASVKTVGSQAFAGCTKLASFTTNAKLKSIGASAFAKCSKLKKLLVKTSVLTKKGVKKSLKGSSVTKVKLTSKAAKAKLKKYKKFFAKGNCGKKVTVSK